MSGCVGLLWVCEGEAWPNFDEGKSLFVVDFRGIYELRICKKGKGMSLFECM